MHRWSLTLFLCEVNLVSQIKFSRFKGDWSLFIYRRKDISVLAYMKHLYWILIVAEEELASKCSSYHLLSSSRLLSHHTCYGNYQEEWIKEQKIKTNFVTICLQLFLNEVCHIWRNLTCINTCILIYKNVETILALHILICMNFSYHGLVK